MTTKRSAPAAGGRPFPGKDVITDLAGLPVEASGLVWQMNEPTGRRSLDWHTVPMVSWDILEATTAYIAELIKNRSPTEVAQNFGALKLLELSPDYMESDGAEVSYKAMSEIRAALGKQLWRMHYLRKWYEWCCDYGCDSFSEEVAFRLSEWTIGGNAKLSRSARPTRERARSTTWKRRRCSPRSGTAARTGL